MNKSSICYKRNNLKKGRPEKDVPDVIETAFPRYQLNNTKSHRRSEKRMDKWL